MAGMQKKELLPFLYSDLLKAEGLAQMHTETQIKRKKNVYR